MDLMLAKALVAVGGILVVVGGLELAGLSTPAIVAGVGAYLVAYGLVVDLGGASK